MLKSANYLPEYIFHSSLYCLGHFNLIFNKDKTMILCDVEEAVNSGVKPWSWELAKGQDRPELRG